MRIVAYYQNETKTLDVLNTEIMFRFEVTSRLVRTRMLELKNMNVDTIGTRLEPLLPDQDDIMTMNKIEIFNDNGMLIKSSSKVINATYRITTQSNNREIGFNPPSMTPVTEVFVVEVE